MTEVRESSALSITLVSLTDQAWEEKIQFKVKFSSGSSDDKCV